MFFGWRVSIVVLISIACPLCINAAGQATSSESDNGSQSRNQQFTSRSGTAPASATAPPLKPAPYGNGDKQKAHFVNDELPSNFLTFGTDVTTEYDSNLNDSRISDVGYVVSPRVDFRREESRWGFAVDYRPSLLFYSHHSTMNQHNQDLNADATLRATQRLSFRAKTTFSQYSGFLTPFLDPSSVSALSSPGNLNNTLLVPYASQLEDNSRVDANYRLGLRSSIGVFGTYLTRSFGQVPHESSALLDTQGHSFGGDYVRLLSPTASIGLNYAYENLHTGPSTRVGLHIASAALAWQLSPRLRLSVFGGPVYTQLRTAELLPFGPLLFRVPVARTDWHWAAGGSLTLESRETAIGINASRQVTDGGGLLTAVVRTEAGLTWSRRVTQLWTIKWSSGWDRNTALLTGSLASRYDSEYGRAVILRRLSESLSMGLGYEYQRQSATGTVPLFARFDRSLAYFTMTYNIHQIALGR
jgi:hypothetical protein